MADELQGLLDRIQSEGLDKARKESDRILADARQQADALIQVARAQADEMRKKAEADAEAFSARARKTVQQAGRDVILWVAESLNRVFTDLVRVDTERVVADDFLRQLLATAVESYAKDDRGTGGISVHVSPAQEQQLAAFVRDRLTAKCRAGIEVRGDPKVVSGFRIHLADGRVQHDFTAEAIANSLGHMLRPHLAALVRDAMKP